MDYNIKLLKNLDGTYDLVLDFPKQDAEFALDFFANAKDSKAYQSVASFLQKQKKDIKIKTVKIMLSGLLIATLPFAMLTTASAASKYSMGYLYGGTVQQQIEQVKKTNNSLHTVSPSYFDINADGTLKINPISQELIDGMHAMNVRVVPFLSNHWDRNAGQIALQDPQGLAEKLAGAIAEYDLDGINVDIENVTHTERDAYTEFVTHLRALIPKEKEVSVAVAANPKNWQTGWHGSYDYAKLAEQADYLMIMAYDEHHGGSAPGPVASIDFVENSIKYALQHTTPDKIVIGVPFYGRMWSTDLNFNGNGVALTLADTLVRDYNATISYNKENQTPVASFIVREGDPQNKVNGKVLTPGNYTLYFENEQSLQAKINLVHEYDLKGVGSWAIGQASDEIWDYFPNWLETGSSETGGGSQETTIGYVTGDELRLRNGPNTTSSTLGFLSKGTTVTILGSAADGWYQVRTPSGMTGFVSAMYISLTPPVTTPQTRTGYVTASVLNVRKSASTSSAIVTTLQKNAEITTVGDAVNGWYQVRLADGTTGYISSEYITFNAPDVSDSKTGYVTASVLNVRKSASTDSPVLTTLKENASVTLVGSQSNGWYQVRLANGTTGYVSAQYISLTAPNTNKTGYVTASVLNVRKSASTASAVVTTVSRGQAVTLLGNNTNGWYQVRLSNGTTGYVSAEYISLTK